MTLGTKTQYAAHRGVSKAYLSKKRIKAMLEPAMQADPADGLIKINFEKADEIFAATRNPEKYIGRGRTESAQEDDGGPRPDSYEEARRQVTLTRLERDRMDLAARKGDTLDRRQVEAAFAAFGQMFRENLDGRRRELADNFSTMTDPNAIQIMIERSDRALLETVCNELNRRLYPGGDGDQPTTH